MELARFQELVEQLQRAAAEDPIGYRRRVGALALFGYLYLALMVALVVGVVVGLVWSMLALHSAILVKLLIPVLGLLVVIVRSLWVKFDRPKGIEVDLATTPALAALVEEIRRASGGPRPDRVLLTGDFNASVVQHPRLGLFGWYENHLILGIPLLQTIPLDEVRAIIAHEFGHLAGSHGRFGAWIYRQRIVYQRFSAAIEAERQGLGRPLLAPLRRWYFPYFNAYSFALARLQEYEADRLAAEVAGVAPMARALARIEVVGRWDRERFIQEIDRLARDGEPIPEDLYERFPAALRGSLTEAEATAWLAEALQVPTDFHDSHPALQDRLHALTPTDGAPPMRWSDTGTPGMALLAPRTAELLRAASTQWREETSAMWADRHAHITKSKRRLEELATKAAAGPLTANEGWERVLITEELAGLGPAADLARQLLASDPSLNGARFVVARSLLAQGDEGGLTELETIIRTEPSAASNVAGIAFNFLWTRGRRADAEQWRRRAEQGNEEDGRAEKERQIVPPKVPLAPHELSAEEIERIREGLRQVPKLRAAYIARRVVKHQPERPCYVVAVTPDVPWWRPLGTTQIRELVDATVHAVVWPGDTRVVTTTHELKGLPKRFRKIPGTVLLGK